MCWDELQLSMNHCAVFHLAKNTIQLKKKKLIYWNKQPIDGHAVIADGDEWA